MMMTIMRESQVDGGHVGRIFVMIHRMADFVLSLVDARRQRRRHVQFRLEGPQCQCQGTAGRASPSALLWTRRCGKSRTGTPLRMMGRRGNHRRRSLHEKGGTQGPTTGNGTGARRGLREIFHGAFVFRCARRIEWIDGSMDRWIDELFY